MGESGGAEVMGVREQGGCGQWGSWLQNACPSATSGPIQTQLPLGASRARGSARFLARLLQGLPWREEPSPSSLDWWPRCPRAPTLFSQTSTGCAACPQGAWASASAWLSPECSLRVLTSPLLSSFSLWLSKYPHPPLFFQLLKSKPFFKDPVT